MRIETISDIVDEMRNCTAKSKDEAWYDQSSWANLCDRIEAAATCEKSSQVGNAAKMREALERLREWVLLDLNENAFIADSSGNYMKLIKGTIEIANVALSAPPRNCDRYRNAYEVIGRFVEERNPIQVKLEDVINWLFAEAKGATDEQ